MPPGSNRRSSSTAKRSRPSPGCSSRRLSTVSPVAWSSPGRGPATAGRGGPAGAAELDLPRRRCADGPAVPPGSDPCWTGTIQRLRLETGGGAAHQLTELVVSRPARLAEFQTSLGQGSSWRIRLGNELRSGFFAPPGAARTWTIPPGPAACASAGLRRRRAHPGQRPLPGPPAERRRNGDAPRRARRRQQPAPDRWHERWIDLLAAAERGGSTSRALPNPGRWRSVSGGRGATVCRLRRPAPEPGADLDRHPAR